MSIKFWKFEEKKVAQHFLVMSFGAPENAKICLFHVVGHLRQLSKPYMSTFSPKTKIL